MVEDSEFVLASHVMLAASLFVWIVTKRRISIGLLAFIILVISVAWKWILLVKRVQSKKLATMFYLEPSCLAQSTGSSWFSNVVEYIWPRKASSCEAYYEAMHVESVWEVSPLDAIVETISDVIIRPFGKFGVVVADIFGAVVDRTPFIWTPVVLLLVFGLFLALIFSCRGYRFKSLFFTLEPTGSGSEPRTYENRPTMGLPPPEHVAQPLPYPRDRNMLDRLVPSIGYDRRPKYHKH